MSRIKVANFRHPDGASDNISLDSSGRLLVGSPSARSSYPLGTGLHQVESANFAISQLFSNGETFDGSYIGLWKSRGGTVGSTTIVQSGDIVGGIYFGGSDGTKLIASGTITSVVDGTPGLNDMPGRLTFSTTAPGATTTTEQMRLTSTGDLRFNSGYGSVATAYGVRAWANINGTGAIAIRDSGNISSITDHGAGQYTFTFTNNLPDANYSFVLTGNEGTPNNGSIVSAPSQSANSTSSIRVDCVNNGGTRIDMEFLSLVIVR